LKTQGGATELPSTTKNLQGPLLVALGGENGWEEENTPKPRET